VRLNHRLSQGPPPGRAASHPARLSWTRRPAPESRPYLAPGADTPVGLRRTQREAQLAHIGTNASWRMRVPSSPTCSSRPTVTCVSAEPAPGQVVSRRLATRRLAALGATPRNRIPRPPALRTPLLLNFFRTTESGRTVNAGRSRPPQPRLDAGVRDRYAWRRLTPGPAEPNVASDSGAFTVRHEDIPRSVCVLQRNFHTRDTVRFSLNHKQRYGRVRCTNLPAGEYKLVR
jgi:hypothetical protein